MRCLPAMGAVILTVSGPALAQIPIGGKIIELRFQTRALVLRVEAIDGGTRPLQAQQTELAVAETATEIRVAMAADVLFDFDSAELRPEAGAALRHVAEIIRANPGASVRIEGHSDALGSESYNQKLSERRAASVQGWLEQTGGLGYFAFVAVGLGESAPAAPNELADGSDNPEGRQQNRRVEIVVEKVPG